MSCSLTRHDLIVIFPFHFYFKRVGRIKEEDDELGTTSLAIASYNSSERSISQMLSTPIDDGDEELTEVFEQHSNDLLDDTIVDASSNVLLLGPETSSSPPHYHRSYSVGAGVIPQSGAVSAGGEAIGIKRFRNWSGTDVGFSPRSSRRQRHKSPPPFEDDKKLGPGNSIRHVAGISWLTIFLVYCRQINRTNRYAGLVCSRCTRIPLQARP